MSILKEFKEFATRGSVVDLAVGVIIGAAFGKIVSSLVTDIVMPPIGKVMGGVNFSDLFLNLDPGKGRFTTLKAARDAGAAVIAYGSFINAVVDFLIVGFSIFIFIKAINVMKRKPPTVPAPEPNREEILLTEIRDILKSR